MVGMAPNDKDIENLCKAFADTLEDLTGKHYYVDFHLACIQFSIISHLFCIMDTKHKQFYAGSNIWSPEIKDILWGKYDSIAIFALSSIRLNCEGDRFIIPYTIINIKVVREDELPKYL